MTNILKDYLTSVGDAIRTRTSIEEEIPVQQFSTIIDNIEIGCILPEFISAQVDENFILSWSVETSILEDYPYDFYYQVSLNGNIITTNETSLDVSEYFVPNVKNIAEISIKCNVFDTKEYSIKMNPPVVGDNNG